MFGTEATKRLGSAIVYSALAVMAPLLDRAGNSVKCQLAARFVPRCLGLSLFVSKPEG
jgi:glutaminase